MPRRKQDPNQSLSLRWPQLFRDPEKAESLFSAEGWTDLLSDLRAREEELSVGIVHDVPYTAEQIAMQNFERGCISVVEDLLGLEEEYRKRKAENK